MQKPGAGDTPGVQRHVAQAAADQSITNAVSTLRVQNS